MVYLFLADGCEEIEALTVVDLLRRAEIEITTVSISDTKKVVGARGIKIESDIFFGEVDWNNAELLVLPGGGPGTKRLCAHDALMAKVDEFAKGGKRVAAICAAPALIFGERGLVNGKKATCYPGMESHLKGAIAVTDSVITDGNITSSRGLGTAIDFALELISLLKSKTVADDIATSVVY